MRPELRHDPVTEEWSVVAPKRAARPQQPAAGCPFCPGHEAETPPTEWEVRDSEGWRLRAFANRFPILAAEGRHEVLVESRRHDWTPEASTSLELRAVLEAYGERFRALAPGAAWLCAFHNQGAAAGGSIAHAHSQLIAAHFVPAGREGPSRRPPAQVAAAEAAGLLLWREGGLAVVVPAAGVTGEARILPSEPVAFAGLSPAGLGAAERLLRRVLCAQLAVFGSPAYNWALAEAAEGFELRVVPRLTTPGGFELASGLTVSELAPEDLAPRLRAAAAEAGAWRPGEDSNP